MAQLFINLPVKDLDASVDFFTKLGFSFNPQYTDEKGTCMIVGDGAFVMLLTEPFFSQFTKKELVSAEVATETIIAISADSKQAVDTMVDSALEAGGHASNETSDQGFMYTRSFQDLDHHLWEVIYMDENAVS
ncbi:MAG TPA: VOC family protein [Candidatus Saccharimonadales bacterium]